MKTTKRTITIAVFSILSILSTFMNAGCGTESITGTNITGGNHSDFVPDSITVSVAKVSGGYEFTVNNNTSSTIVNDFHVQFDTTVSIIEWGLLWQFDPPTTNLPKGKIGEKASPGQQPISPHQQKAALWVKVRYNGKKVIKDFNWQATRNGIIVQSGSGTLPD